MEPTARKQLDLDGEADTPFKTILRQQRADKDKLQTTARQQEQTIRRQEKMITDRHDEMTRQRKEATESSQQLSAAVNQLTAMVTRAQMQQTGGHNRGTQPDHPQEEDQDEDPQHKGNQGDSQGRPQHPYTHPDYPERNESGSAAVLALIRAIPYKHTDPDFLSEKKDIDGVESHYKRLSEKRPLLFDDAEKMAKAKGAELQRLAESLHRRIADGLEPGPSIQCSILITLHDPTGNTREGK